MVALLQILSRLFNVVQFVKCWQYFLELSSKRLSCSGKEKESRCLEFTSSTKCEVRDFHVVVVHWRQRNVQKSVMHVQGCCFSNLTFFFFLPLTTTPASSPVTGDHILGGIFELIIKDSGDEGIIPLSRFWLVSSSRVFSTEPWESLWKGQGVSVVVA